MTTLKPVGPDGRVHRTPVLEAIKVVVPTRVFARWVRRPAPSLSRSSPIDGLFQDCGDNELHAIQFHPSGSLMATGGSDRKIHIWEINPHNSEEETSIGNSSNFRS